MVFWISLQRADHILDFPEMTLDKLKKLKPSILREVFAKLGMLL